MRIHLATFLAPLVLAAAWASGAAWAGESSEAPDPGIDLASPDAVVAALAGETNPAPNTYALDHHKRITSAQVVGALGADLFGEQVNLYTGSTTFEHTDLDLPGNFGLPVRAARRLSVEHRKTDPFGHAFGDWELDVPHMSGTYAASVGWVTTTTDSQGHPVASNNRCSSPSSVEQVAPPFATASGESSIGWHGYEIWHGNSLYVPGTGSQTLLFADSVISGAPAHKWRTKDYWLLTCTSTITGGSGEGFIAHAPDGTKYTFNRLATRPAAAVAKRTIDPSSTVALQRNEVRLYVTEVRDRFNNTVTYNWGGSTPATVRLNSISASDGRTITFSYANSTSTRVTSVNDGSRNVTYDYATGDEPALRRVNFQDSSFWEFGKLVNGQTSWSGLAGLYPTKANGGSSTNLQDWDHDVDCASMRRLSANTGDGFIRHPSGAEGHFQFRFKRHIRSGVPINYCNLFNMPVPPTELPPANLPPEGEPQEYVSSIPRRYDTLSIITKTITGPGMDPLYWSYFYNSNSSTLPYDAEAFPSSQILSVLEPDAHYTEYHFGRKYNENEGQLLQITTHGASYGQVQRRVNSYRTSNAGFPFADSAGISPNFSLDNFAAEKLRPLRQSVLVRNDGQFIVRNNSYNEFAAPTNMWRWGPVRLVSDTTVLSHNLSRWIINQPTSLMRDGVEVWRHTLDSHSMLPMSTTRFGNLEATLAYHADGNLHTTTDGRSQTTTLASYYRGIPRSVSFADSTSIGAVVNNLGNITSATDQLGFTTSYGYDSMGRLNLITYPTADSTPWTPRSITFAKSTSAQYGIAAGHWRQTVNQGNYRKITYLDALWRPVVTQEWDAGNVAGTQRFVQRRFDHEGREWFTSYPSSSLGSWNSTVPGETRTYDVEDRLKSIAQTAESTIPGGVLTTTYEYLTGNRKQVTNPRGQVTTYTYLSLDEPSEEFPTLLEAPEGAVTRIERDIFNKPTSIVREGMYNGSLISATRSFVYDAKQRLCKTVEPETGAKIIAYDLANNIDWTADGLSLTGLSSCDRPSVPESERTYRNYDAMNRLTRVDYPGSTVDLYYGYYNDGALSEAWTDAWNPADPASTAHWSYLYNKRRMLSRETITMGAWKEKRFDYAYNGLGHVSSLTHTLDGNTLTIPYSPNALGQATQAGSFATGAQYFPNGAIKQYNFGNDIQRVNTQNARQLISRTRDTYLAQTYFDYQYGFDGNANVTQIQDLAPGGIQSRNMGYDGLDRLTSANAPATWGTASYTYDPLDNLRTASLGSTQYRYVYGATNWRLTHIQTPAGATLWNLGSDARGNITSKNLQSHLFDRANRITAIPGLVDQYAYDAHGRRVTEIGTSNTGSSIYTLDGVLRSRLDAAGNWKNHVYLGNQLVATTSLAGGTWTTLYHHTDNLGSTVADTTAGRAKINSTCYAPYGKPLSQPAGCDRTTIDGPGYTGHLMDSGTGLTYMQQRYYDHDLGRFLSVDPMAVSGATGWNFNRYAYANNNPYKYVDPDGENPIGVVGAIVRQAVIDLAIESAVQYVTTGEVDLRAAAGNVAEGLVDPGKKIKRVSGALRQIVGKRPARGDIASNGARGRESEKRVLADMGESKNTEVMRGGEQPTIPDFQNSTQVGDIKDAARVTDSAQLRSQRTNAEATGREHVVVTGTNTHVTDTVESKSRVIRRDDLGPKEQ